MRLVALMVIGLLALPAVAGARKHHHRHHKRVTLHGHVRKSIARAPKAWSFVAAVPTPTPVPTVAPGATPTPTPVATATPVPTSSLPPVNSHSVSVGSTEYKFVLSQTTVSAGDVKIQFDNSRAQDAHELAVDGPDPDYWDFGKQDAGTVTQRTITMKPGTYVLFCPLPQHEDLGMKATLTVR